MPDPQEGLDPWLTEAIDPDLHQDRVEARINAIQIWAELSLPIDQVRKEAEKGANFLEGLARNILERRHRHDRNIGGIVGS